MTRKEFTLSFPVVLLVVISNFYLLGLSYAMDVVKAAAGLYDQDKWVPLAQAAVNLAVSILLGRQIGLAGIFWGTLISTLIPLIAKPLIVYPRVFACSPLSYFLTMLYELASAAVLCGLSVFLCSLLPHTLTAFLRFLLSFAITVPTSLGCFFLFHWKSPHLPALLSRFRSLLSKRR